MNCPKCGYKMSETDLDCPRCEKYQSISAGAAAEAEGAAPGFTPPWRDTEIQSGVRASEEEENSVNMNAVYFMWGLTCLYFMLYGARAGGLASICGFGSFVMAIFLVCNHSARIRTHGWVRLGIGGVIGLFTFMNVMSR